MEKLLFTAVPVDLIITEISQRLKEELSLFLAPPTTSKSNEEILTRKQAAELLGISLTTLHEWTLAGKVPAYRISSRIRYKRIEVEQSLKQIKSVKCKGGLR
jgi:excisionase family DNA binding protein